MGLVRGGCVAALALSLIVGVPSASAAPRISLGAAKRSINFGKSTQVRGRLAGVAQSGNVRIALQVKPFPYASTFRTLATKKTDAAGRFAFTVKPDRNSRYRAQAVSGSPTSGQVPVFVNGISLTFIKTKGAIVNARMTFSFSRKLGTGAFSGLSLHWYYKPSSSKRFRRVRTTRTHRMRAGQIGGSLRYKIPKATSKQKFTISWCFRPHKHGDVGIGDPRTSFKACP
jgi:hypothetical protein